MIKLLKRLVFVISEITLRRLGELEFRIWEHAGRKSARRLYLRLMRVVHGKVFSFGLGFYVRNRGNLSLGERCWVGSFCRIWNYEPIDIGEDFLAAGGLTLNGAGHDPVTLKPLGAPIKIGKRVWCGLNVTVLAGVTVGDDVVIGAGSLVNKDIAPNSIVAGVPAKWIRELHRTQADHDAIRMILS